MSKTWIEYEQGSAVQKAIAVVNGIEAQGGHIIYMHQGAEATMPHAPLYDYLTYQGSNSSKYNSARGHTGAIEATAQFAQDFLGLPAEFANTVVLQDKGRTQLGHAFHFANQAAVSMNQIPRSIVPNLRWPMVEPLAKDAYSAVSTYELKRNNLAQEIKSTIRSVRKRGVIPTNVYTGLPANPTGYKSSQQEGREILNVTDTHNRNSTFKLTLTDDNPYFASLDQKENGSILTAPFEGIKRDGDTPSIHLISFSKAFGTAKPGFTFSVMTNTKMAEQYVGYIKRRGGCAYDENNMANMAEMLNPRNYPLIREHLGFLKTKYTNNFNAVSQSLGKNLVDGDPGMVCTIKVPADALNKLATCVDGVKREITNARKVAEYIANTHGVMVVDQSTSNGEAFLRLALKSEDIGEMQDGAEKIAKSFIELQSFPSLAA